jgi:integrase
MLKVQNRVLSKNEIAKVAKYHKNWRRRDLPGPQLRFAIFRLSCCCGLRCKEIVGVNLGDFFFDSESPFIRIRKDITKGHRKTGTVEVIRKPRKVSLKIDDDTLADLKKWYDFRVKQSGGDMSAPFICGQTDRNRGKRLNRGLVASIWKTSLRTLGAGRVLACSIHAGRHTAISHLVWGGWPMTFIRDFAGHRSIATTCLYSHTFDETTMPKNAFRV